LRHFAAIVLTLLVLVAAAPTLVPTDTDGLPAFDDDDSDGVAPPAACRSSLAILPPPTAPLDEPIARMSASPRTEAIASNDRIAETLASRAPPRSQPLRSHGRLAPLGAERSSR
jgi:hypothetical protein